MYKLRGNETNLTSRNTFVLDRFLLRGEKESRYKERTVFWDSLQKIALFVNETKLTSRNVFTLDLLVLGGEK